MSKKVKKEKKPKKPDKKPKKAKRVNKKKVKGRYTITAGMRTIERDEFHVYGVNIKERKIVV